MKLLLICKFAATVAELPKRHFITHSQFKLVLKLTRHISFPLQNNAQIET
jgi:hypothetical protein